MSRRIGVRGGRRSCDIDPQHILVTAPGAVVARDADEVVARHRRGHLDPLAGHTSCGGFRHISARRVVQVQVIVGRQVVELYVKLVALISVEPEPILIPLGADV